MVVELMRRLPARRLARAHFASQPLTGVMGLPVDATPADVKRKYRALALETHPDRLPAGATAADRERVRQRFARLPNEYEARLNGLPPHGPLRRGHSR